MAGLPLLTYLPPGWTEATYQNATTAEYNVLPEEQLESLMERKVQEARQEAALILYEARTWRAAHGIAALAVDGAAGPSAAPGPADTDLTQRLVRRVEAAQWAEMGFLVFRTFYADEPLWASFQQLFSTFVDGGILAAAPGTDLARISSRVKLPLVSDYALVDLGPGGIAQIYRDSVSNLDSDDSDDEEGAEEEDEGGHLASLDPGLRMPMCLMVDEECLRSMVHEDEGTVPFVKAVDARLATNRDLRYPGWFKVAVGALMPRFYAAAHFYEPVDMAGNRLEMEVVQCVQPPNATWFKSNGVTAARLLVQPHFVTPDRKRGIRDTSHTARLCKQTGPESC